MTPFPTGRRFPFPRLLPLAASVLAAAGTLRLPAHAQNLSVTSGLQLWLRADAGVTTGAGDAVVGWNDQSPQNNHAFQPDENLAPQRVANALNGQPVIRFAGNGEFLEVLDSESLSFAGDLTTFFVVRFADFSNYNAVWAKTSVNLPAPTDWYTLPNSGVPRLYRGNGTSSDLGSFDGAALRADTFLVVGFDIAGSQATHYLGAQPTRSGALNAVPGDADTSLFIGTRGDFFTRLKGDLAEVLIYDRALPAEERAAVVDYLAGKYDIRNLAPSITLARSPAGPNVAAGSVVTLTATASDPDGTISRVEFLANESVVATAVAPPYVARVILESAGSFRLSARAVDDKDAAAVSEAFAFTVAPGGTPSLTATNHLQLWLRADMGVTASGGGAVTAWADQSGQGNHAAQPDEGLAPTLVPNALNGQPVLRFDGSDDYLEVADSDSLSIAGDITSLFVVKMDNFGTFRAVWGKTQVNQPAPNDYYTLPGSGVPRFYRGNSAGSLGFADGGTAFRAGAYELAGFSALGTDVIHLLNGQVSSTAVINATPADLDTPLRIGTRDDFVTVLQGDLAELLIFDAALEAEHRRHVELYLAEKYALGILSVTNTPPSVTLTAPAPASSVASPATVTVDAAASDPDGSVVRVDFLVNGVLAASDPSAPYSAALAFPAADRPILTAVAVDNFGRAAESAPVAVTVTSTTAIALPAAASLKLWLRADAGVTAANGLVSAWEDQSGHQHTATQSTAAAQPSVVANAINNRPALRFDGEDDALAVAHTFRIASVADLTSYAVVRLDDFDTFRAIWAKTQGNQPRSTDIYVLPTTGIPRVIRGGVGLGSVDGTNPLVPGEFAILGVEMAGTSLRQSLNGLPNGEGMISAPLRDEGTPLLIGTRGDGVTRLRGELAELILYNAALSAEDRASVIAYLGDKYGIAVPASPPRIRITRAGSQVTLSWPALSGFVLESSPVLPGAAWQAVPGVVNNGVTVDAGSGTGYYRLRQQ